MKLVNKLIRTVYRLFMEGRLSQESVSANGSVYHDEQSPDLCRMAASEGMVLLKNDGTLPLRGERIAPFGRCLYETFYIGYGSGGDVNPPYRVSYLQGLRNSSLLLDEACIEGYTEWCKQHPVDEGYWAHWPTCFPERPMEEREVLTYAQRNDVALVVIGRSAGEDRDCTLTEGSYYLTQAERTLLSQVCKCFSRVVVIVNSGTLIDMSWVEEYPISALLYAWHCGMESGNALADLLIGKVSPSGKLTDTIARHYADYPAQNYGDKLQTLYTEDVFVGYRYFETFQKESVLFPFGYGLTYTTFFVQVEEFRQEEDCFSVTFQVTNTGNYIGQEVIQLYVECPQGNLPQPKRKLVAFLKTPPMGIGERQTFTLTCKEYDFASYDVATASYVIEGGNYAFALGNDVRSAQVCGEVQLENKVLKTCVPICALSQPLTIQVGIQTYTYPATNSYIKERVLANLPKQAEGKGGTFQQVKSGEITMDDFIAGLSNKELEALTRGHGSMSSPLGVNGNAGTLGGVIPSLRKKGVGVATATDGPAGLRLGRFASLLPCGTAIACTWNTSLVEQLYRAVGREMTHYGTDLFLGGGMNLHRNPLCGRNFEYFSEDPLLSGKISAALVRGIQKEGHSACPKHFACNNQEANRSVNSSVVSERALRELYLKGFEICIEESNPYAIMTAYNKINGVWAHYHHDLCSTLLRGEWHYQGLVITDWWMRASRSPEFPELKDNAYRVRSEVDVLMPGNMSIISRRYRRDGHLWDSLGKVEGITRGEVEKAAKRTLEFLIKIQK